LKRTEGFPAEKIGWVLRRLKKQVSNLSVPYLEHMVRKDRSPFRVLVSCILSLRTQDKTTSEASERLFSLAETPEDLALLPVKEIEKAIYPVGFYRVKAGNLRKIAREIVTNYNGTVPDSIEELLKLDGVGRKTANLVVTLGWNRPGICVDTHVHRITNRWGYVKTKTPEETEFALREKLPRRYWKEINGLLVAFGQGICKPVSPLCSRCCIYEYCQRIGVKKSR
jgi:endonuclease-3